jgi:hypothetical protein
MMINWLFDPSLNTQFSLILLLITYMVVIKTTITDGH